nr:hypothetical protein [Tanacetum cinerariifolium]
MLNIPALAYIQICGPEITLNVFSAAAVNVGGRLRETRSSLSFRPTSLTNISDVINAAAANLGGHLCQPESSSSFCQASSREIFFKSLGVGLHLMLFKRSGGFAS